MQIWCELSIVPTNVTTTWKFQKQIFQSVKKDIWNWISAELVGFPRIKNFTDLLFLSYFLFVGRCWARKTTSSCQCNRWYCVLLQCCFGKFSSLQNSFKANYNYRKRKEIVMHNKHWAHQRRWEIRLKCSNWIKIVSEHPSASSLKRLSLTNSSTFQCNRSSSDSISSTGMLSTG